MAKYTYIHVPFCTQKCKYCAFTSFINLNLIEKYVDSLLFQIENSYKKEKQKTLYIGGGTPSLLTIEQINKIIEKFEFEKEAEITIEINPENSNYDYLKELNELGFNRISIGAQSFCDEILKETGRRHNSKDIFTAIENANKAGFENISIDLIYGLSNQTEQIWEESLKVAKSLDITHISTYGLKIEDGTYYKKFPPKNVADEEEQAAMYKNAIKILDNFELYEISNFAKSKEFYSKHNLNYWNLEPYDAYGVSASGFDGKTRYTNTNNIKKYFENPNKKDEEINLTKDNLLEETIFLGFRKKEGIKTEAINKKFEIDFDKKYKKIIEKYEKTGHIEKTKDGYRLSTEGFLVSNYILCDFLC